MSGINQICPEEVTVDLAVNMLNKLLSPAARAAEGALG
jgi:hypothetical protein